MYSVMAPIKGYGEVSPRFADLRGPIEHLGVFIIVKVRGVFNT